MAHVSTDKAEIGPKRLFGQVQVEMTGRCNLRCRTCLYPAYEKQWIQQDLSTDSFDRVLNAAGRCESVHLQGWGESLLREDIAQRVGDLTAMGGRPTLSSNGAGMKARLAKELIDGGLRSMAFSLAGPNRRLNDALRGAGTFAETVSGIRTFVRRRRVRGRPPVLINYLLTPHSFPLLPEALALSSRLGADTLVATHLIHTCTKEQCALAVFSQSHRYRWPLFRSRWAVLWRKSRLVLPGVKKSPMPVCAKNPMHNLFVAADGAVSPCVYLCPPIRGVYRQTQAGKQSLVERLVMGRLSAHSLEEIWHRPDYVAFRKAFQRRLDLYGALMPPVRTDFEGLDRLEKATRKLEKLFASPEYSPPDRCRGCAHLSGY